MNGAAAMDLARRGGGLLVVMLLFYSLMVAWVAFSHGYYTSLDTYRGLRPGQVGMALDPGGRPVLWGDEAVKARVQRAFVYEWLTQAYIESEVRERMRQTWMP